MNESRHDIPSDWDALVDRGERGTNPDDGQGGGRSSPPIVTLMASAWADLVTLLAVCAGALLMILVVGERPSLPVFWWAMMLALLWWGLAAAILVIVRLGTPGMLLAGVRFDSRVARQRLPWVLAAALLAVTTLGLVALAGDHAVLRAAGGSTLRMLDQAP